MRADAERADRHREVRRAARGWHAAGILDAAPLAAVEKLYPDDRNRLGPAFRSLAFLFTGLALLAFWLFVLAIAGWNPHVAGPWALLYGAGLAVLADIQTGALRRDEGGSETATAIAGVALLLGGVAWFLDDVLKIGGGSLPAAFLGIASLLLAGAAVRWGSTVQALFASLAFYAFLAQLPGGRVLWVVAALAIAPLALRFSESPALAPSHRRSCDVVLAVSLLALYVAVHIGSWDSRFVEHVAGSPDSGGPAPGPRLPLILATAMVPLALLAFGVARRRRLLILLGVVLAIASLVTLRFYVHVAPLWVVLTAGGGFAIAVALGLRRWLASGAGDERGGFTALPLFEDPAKRHALETAASMVAAPPALAENPPSFSAGGGTSGGGGATDTY
jgi:hypothetical protein